jgi:hypothetical protein
MRKRKPGPKPKPRREVRRHNVLVKLNDAELALVRQRAAHQPLATYLREVALAS